ncbi:hypothetical protein GCM10009604_10450 [Corynebacterium aurimucosum]
MIAVRYFGSGLARVGDAQAVVCFFGERGLPDIIPNRAHSNRVGCGDELDGFGTGAASADGTVVPPIEIMGRVVAAVVKAFEV